ncbi:phosphorylcholine transferase LicD [Ruminococcus flavefaciens]|uniref:LicD family protein n=1 Tax=Ruminococcus flavefaciens TaxID=1265 RepID=UPI0026EA62E0|nr:LicD family protein [Ruminococcus flavefaciens]
MGKEIKDLKDIQALSLTVLKRFDEICQKNGFKYFLAYGTLIGAIRHNGFIPWDDDIDVMMPRKDFNRFIAYTEKHKKELYPLKLHNRRNTENYYYGIPRFSDMKYQYTVIDNYEKGFDIGVFIDIYPLDNFGNNREDAERLFKKCRQMNREFDWYVNTISKVSFIRTLVRKTMHCLMHIKYKKDYKNEIDKRIEKYILNNTSEDDKYIGVVLWASKIWQYDKSKLQGLKTVRHKFEDYEFNIPAAYDYMLKKGYGDYMQLPKEEDRHPYHNYRIQVRDNLENNISD